MYFCATLKINILWLNLRSSFTELKFPKFHQFWSKHCVSRTFHSFPYIQMRRSWLSWHEFIWCKDINSFREPIPSESTEGSLRYVQGSNPSETFFFSKLENPAKRNNVIPFIATTQTILNEGVTIKCSESRRPHVIYAKKNFLHGPILMQWTLNGFQYVCGAVFDIKIDALRKIS